MSGYEPSFRDRLAALSRAELVGLLAIAVVAIGGAAVWYVRSLPRPIDVAVTGPGDPGPGAAGEVAPTPGPSPAGATIFVHVVGRVKDPGVFEFDPGARVVDALRAAGGPRKGAALTSLNLAAPLVDGQQVVVAAKGAEPAGTAPGTAGAPATGLVNVNTAGLAELDTLPGVGPVIGQAIIDHRTEHGPFASVDQLEEVSGIGPATLEKLRDLVTV